ncbi:MAG TPA: glycoside hydrolase family 16 protein [Spirochaetota bacterium]|nr:glycoside hydrolase family 16 protein [Spirochaetota bacterium]
MEKVYSQLVWQENFSTGPAPDAGRWHIARMLPGTVNEEAQNYVDRRKNCRLEQGRCIIEACHDNYDGYPYSSAKLTTRGKVSWDYFRLEARARLPQGQGTWPAIWMMPSEPAYGNWPDSGEIDIMEHVGKDPGNVHASVHSRSYYWKEGTERTAIINLPQIYTDFHTYGIIKEPGRIRIYADDKIYFDVSRQSGDTWKEWPFEHRFYLILNLAIGGVWGGEFSNDIFPTRFVIDNIKVFQ